MISSPTLNQSQTTAARPPLRLAREVGVNLVIARWCQTHTHNGQPLDIPLRFWLVLRSLDPGGRGWLALPDVEATLTNRSSPHYLLDAGDLQEVLEIGEGVFWNRYRAGNQPDGEWRIFLNGHTRIREALGCGFICKSDEVRIPTDDIYFSDLV